LLFAEASVEDVREFVGHAWYETVGSGDERHLRAGTQVVQVKSWRGVRGYAAKYLGKLETLQTPRAAFNPECGVRTGRLWGVWYRALLPIFEESYRITLRSFFRIRRAFRRLSGQRSTHQTTSASCFLEHSTALRLLI
jgi:hypothetical protein